MSNITALPIRKPRLSPKLRQAIDLIVMRGATVTDAAEKAGLSRQGLHKAMKRPAVKDEIESLRLQMAGNFDRELTEARALALVVARDLMMNSMSESMRARMAKVLIDASRRAKQAAAEPPSDAGTGQAAAELQTYHFVRPTAS